MLENESFSANYYIKKSSNYLVNPNNLLTHTHTDERPITHYAYARETCLAIPIDKGLSRSFLCPMPRVP